MEVAGVDKWDLASGLKRVFCPTCQHEGFVSRHGLRLLWCDSREYVYSYGPSPAHFVIIIYAPARTHCEPLDWTASDLTAAVVSWALLKGWLSGTIVLGEHFSALQQFNAYIQQLKAVLPDDDTPMAMYDKLVRHDWTALVRVTAAWKSTGMIWDDGLSDSNSAFGNR